MKRAIVVRREDSAASLEVEVDGADVILWFIDGSGDEDEPHLIAKGHDILAVLDELRRYALAALPAEAS